MNNVGEKGNDQEPILSNSTSSPKHHMGKEHIQLRWQKIKTIRVESQWDSSFPADGHKASLIKVDEKAMIRNRYNRIPHTSPDTIVERNTNNQDCINPCSTKQYALIIGI